MAHLFINYTFSYGKELELSHFYFNARNILYCKKEIKLFCV